MNLLINPREMVQLCYTPPPLGLLYLAGMGETTILDAALTGQSVSAYLEQHRPALVGVPIYTPQRHDSLNVLRIAKEYGARTVAGGPHVALLTNQLVEHYPFVDHWVVGDGELAWRALCAESDLPRVVSMPIPRLDDLPLPGWDTIDISAYPPRGGGLHRGNDLGILPRVSIILGRGCDGACNFCSTWWVNGKYRAHGQDWMARHLDLLWQKGVRHLVFQDDCLSANRQATLDLCDVLDQYTFSWHGTTRADCVDEDLAVRLGRAGCYGLSFGIESGSPEMLDRMNKKTDLNAALTARRACAQAGIWFTALVIGGYPGQSARTITQEQDFLRRLQPDETGSVGATWVLPGTVLYQQCKRAGLIDDDFWLGPEPLYVYRGGL